MGRHHRTPRALLKLITSTVVALIAAVLPATVNSSAHAVSAPTAFATGSVVASDDLSLAIGAALAYAYDDVLWDVCEVVPRLNDYGFTYDEASYCRSTAAAAWAPDLSLNTLCAGTLAPPGQTVVDIVSSKTSLWTLDAAGNARGCVFPQLGASDIKSIVSRFRTSMTAYRTAGFNDIVRALTDCDSIVSDRACQVLDSKTGKWIPDPKRLPILATPPAPALVTATFIAVPGVVSMSAGESFQVFAKADGTVTARCDSASPAELSGQCTAPSAAAGALRVAAAGRHALALRSDGTVMEWGGITVAGTPTSARAPSNLTNVVDVAAGQDFALALKADGSVSAWGDGSLGQLQIPATATDVVRIAAGRCHAVALRADGKVVSWGCNNAGQTTANTQSATAISASRDRTVLWAANGTVRSYGTSSAATDVNAVPAGLRSVQIAGGQYFDGAAACTVDKTEDVIRDDIAATSPRADAPTALTSAGTSANANEWLYSWAAPTRTGSSAITGYVVRWDNQKGRNFSQWTPASSPFLVPKAPPGLLARLEVKAVTAAGYGAIAHIATSEMRVCGDNQASDIAVGLSASGDTAPAAPIARVESATATSVRVWWNSTDQAGPAGRPTFVVKLSTDGKSWTTSAARGFSTTLSGLKPATTYQVQVVASSGALLNSSALLTISTLSDAQASGLAATSVLGRSVGLTWKAPTAIAAKDIKDYRISYSNDGLSWTTFARAASTKTTATVTGLSATTTYSFRVTVVTTVGDGAASATVTATTKTDVPGLVGSLLPSAITATGFQLTWAEPADNGGLPITGYLVTLKPVAGKVTISGTTATVTGVKNGASYTVSVAGVNSKGSGLLATTKVLVATPPAAPTATIARSATGVTLTWKAPKITGGSKVLGYRTSVSPASLNYSVTGTKAVFVGLPTGTRFTFTVRAYNAIGDGDPLTITTGTSTAPGTVTSLSYSTKDSKTVSVSWAAPLDDGGSKVTSYKLRTSSDGGKTWSDWATAKSPVTLARPTVGGSLRVDVAAVSLIGTGASTVITITG